MYVQRAFRGAANTPRGQTPLLLFPTVAGREGGAEERGGEEGGRHAREGRKSRWRLKVDGKRGTEKHMRASFAGDTV